MGLFQSLFGQENKKIAKEEKKVPWIQLTSLGQLEEIEKKSENRAQAIFKHSTTCGISRMVMKMFSENYNFSEDQIDLYYLDLHAHRAVSNAISQKFNVHHQSPQLLIVKKGKVVKHASHGSITDVSLEVYM